MVSIRRNGSLESQYCIINYYTLRLQSCYLYRVIYIVQRFHATVYLGFPKIETSEGMDFARIRTNGVQAPSVLYSPSSLVYQIGFFPPEGLSRDEAIKGKPGYT